MRDTVIFLAVTTLINCSDKLLEKRKQQYIEGLIIFFNFIKKYSDQCDIILVDNSVDKIDEDIQKICPENVIIIAKKNNMGEINKGVGIVEMWMSNMNIIKKYKWFIHFEPRQHLKSCNFFDVFFNEKQNIFRRGWYLTEIYYQVMTGLFSLETQYLNVFFNDDVIQKMLTASIHIESLFYDKLNEYKCNYLQIEKLDLIWFRGYSNKKRSFDFFEV